MTYSKLTPLLEVVDLNTSVAVYTKVRILMPKEEKGYRQDDKEAGNRQFMMADPGDYLCRFFDDLDKRPAANEGKT